MAKGRLRIYLGAAPGVGKTFAMLNEGWRGHERGKDVVVGYVETHRRPSTEQQLRDLEVIPRRRMTYRDQELEEMDLDAILARKPEIALIDEMAHTNVPGSRHAKRWEDIEELLDAGIDVISTINIQHLESLNDVVAGITGVVQRERVPDQVVRAADQIELVDMSPESLRRRMAHGNIYRSDKVDAALGNYFRVGNLSALRELALLWVADRVDEGLQEYRERHGIAQPWETKERVVVALTGSPRGESLIRRGARMAARTHAELVGVHIRPSDGLSRAGTQLLEAHRLLLIELGGRYAEVTGADTATALINFAREENATQLLLGATARSRWNELIQGSVINQVIRAADGIDIHVLSDRADSPDSRRLPKLPKRGQLARLPARRRLTGWILALAGIPFVCLVLVGLRAQLGTTSGLPELLTAVVVVAAVGGTLPALVAAVVSFALADWYLIPPIHSWTIQRPSDLGSLVAFIVVAVTVSLLIDRLARRNLDTARAKAESEALARLAGGAVLSGRSGTDELVDEIRATFGVPDVAVLARRDDQAPAGDPEWRLVASSGSSPPMRPEDGAFSAELAEGSVLVIGGESLSTSDRRLLGVFVAQLRMVQAQQQLEQTAAEATSLAETNELRTALLAAVSHDLRTPLASIKASATSLLSDEVTWSPEVQRSFYETIDAEADRLNDLVGNLLDMSRLQTGAVRLAMRPVGLDEVVFTALASISGDTSLVAVDVPESLTPVVTDPALLERAIANLISNAIAYSNHHVVHVIGAVEIPELGANPSSDGAPAPERVELRIIDRGPGIPASQRDAVFRPFQRFGDGGNAHVDGVGLGLAVARGFVEAVHGSLFLDDTPGGGLTAVVCLPAATSSVPPFSASCGPGDEAPGQLPPISAPEPVARPATADAPSSANALPATAGDLDDATDAWPAISSPDAKASS
jgi:two-component system, OmpR family, sensor histidine kinase KdpD